MNIDPAAARDDDALLALRNHHIARSNGRAVSSQWMRRAQRGALA